MDISVIIPMYNAESSIQRCISSVVNQTYKGNVEIIIVNDGSTDNGKAIIDDYRIKNEAINITLINKENGGVSSARNEGMKVSSGDFIAFLDSDDEWLPSKLQRQMEILKKDSSIDFLAGIIFEAPEEHSGKLREIALKDLIYKNYFQPSTVIMKKKVYTVVGKFNESQRFAEEGNYFMRIANQFKCILLYEKLIVYGDGKSGFGESGLSANLLEMEKGELLNLRFAYTNGYISGLVYFMAKSYSLLKYLRRILIVKMRKI
ncbi:glycosyltransferase family A protein [Pedobacter sp. UYP1]|uniref:glycosyltransferase family 2 protein n=1 Tax=Pedobacter sp. UYP1 TaxID=1756396 RepID=UPI00339B966E